MPVRGFYVFWKVHLLLLISIAGLDINPDYIHKEQGEYKFRAATEEELANGSDCLGSLVEANRPRVLPVRTPFAKILGFGQLCFRAEIKA